MKRVNIFLLSTVAVILFFATGCKKDFLDVKPPTMVMEDFFTSEDNARLAVNGCYDVMGWDGNHNTIPYFFGDIIGRDGWKGGDVGDDQDWMDNLINFTYTTDNYMLNIAWKNYYIGINRCNTALENIQDMDADLISDDVKAELMAEARFVRGYFYFELVKTFGSVPLIDHVLSPSEYQQPLAEISDLWAFIENDFKAASEVLPTRSQQNPENVGRATKGAALAFLAKAYIYQKKWGEAKQVTDEIIAGNEYDLMPNYADVFKMENENNEEIVFSIQFKETGNGDYGDENEGSMLEVYMQTRNHPFAGIGGWGFNCPTKNLVDEYEADDSIRRESTIIRNGETLWKDTPDESTFNTTFPTNKDHYSNQKYVLPPSEQPADFSDASKNWILIRYADVLLWNAEAAFHAGGDWQTPLQKVRDRVGLGPTPYSGLDAIYHERRVELAMEGHRFWDVVRQGRGEELYGQYGYVEGVNNHFPIPQDQLDLSDIW
jgi:hypothetical protein